MSFPFNTHLNPIVESQDPEAKYYPSGEKATLYTSLEWSFNVLMRSPLDTLHNMIVVSSDPDARNYWSSENATLLIGPE